MANVVRHPFRSLSGPRLTVVCVLAAIGIAVPAHAQDLQSQLDQRQSELSQQRDRKGVLSSELADFNDQVDQLAGEVATLRNREAIVVSELRQVQARLNNEKDRLDLYRAQLRRSLNVLRN